MSINMFSYNICGIKFALAEKRDMTFLSEFGVVKCAFDQNDSGNISFGVEKNGQKYFIKVAGVKTISAAVSQTQAKHNLKHAAVLYQKIRHPLLIPLINVVEINDLYIAVFPWQEGECLFDHWNFENYKRVHKASPFERFLNICIEKRLRVMDALFSFFVTVNEAGYIATDFYDGSLLYHFGNNEVMFCDIDFFTELPSINETGRVWGSERFKAPEEYVQGAILNAATDVYHLGVFTSLFFGKKLTKCPLSEWTLSEHRYRTMKKATENDPKKRYQTVWEFYEDWKK